VADERASETKEAQIGISGHILISAGIPAFRGATVHIYLDEIRGEDTAAGVVAEEIIQDIAHELRAGEDTNVAFTIQIDPRRLVVSSDKDYAVRVWVDCNSNGERGLDDLYSDQRYSVSPGHPERPFKIRVAQR
jgi:uncharacterized lipoprotein YbaY